MATFVALGALVFFAWHDVVDAFHRLRELNVWVLIAVVPLLFLFYLAIAKFFYHFFRAIGAPVDLKPVFTSMLELNFVNHVFPSGGLSGFSYLTMRLKPFGVSTAKTTFAQFGRFGFGFAFQIVLMFLSLFLLAIEGKTSQLIILIVTIFVFILLIIGGITMFIISSERRSAYLTRGLAHFLNRLIHIFWRKRPEAIRLDKVESTFMELHEDYRVVRDDYKRMRSSMVWICVATLFEMSLLYVVFVAHGVWINPGAVIIAFAIANTAGLIVALPGGIGVFEALMTGVFIAVGVPPGLALSATLVYRVVILILSLLTGAALYHRAVVKMDSYNASSHIHR